MDKRLLVGLLVLTLAFGCGGGNNTGNTGGSGASFAGGTDGLDVQFNADAPPNEVFDTSDSTFDISLKLENLGEQDVAAQKGKVMITGIDPADFGNPTLTRALDFPLLGARLDAKGVKIPGTIGNVDFTNIRFTSKITGTVPFSLRASVCYKYTSKAIAKMCVLKKLMAAEKTTDVCKVTRSLQPENSGSPIHITDFSQYPTGKNQIGIRFKVKHIGAGKVFDPATDAECDEITREKADKVKVKVDVGTGMTVKCQSLNEAQGPSVEGILNLYSGERDITCSVNVPTLDDFEKPISISVDYNYLKSTTKSLTVRHIGEEE